MVIRWKMSRKVQQISNKYAECGTRTFGRSVLSYIDEPIPADTDLTQFLDGLYVSEKGNIEAE